MLLILCRQADFFKNDLMAISFKEILIIDVLFTVAMNGPNTVRGLQPKCQKYVCYYLHIVSHLPECMNYDRLQYKCCNLAGSVGSRDH